jgi:hypothetical protein
MPFTIHVADRRSLPVPHPDFIAIGGNDRLVIVTSPSNQSPSYSVIDAPMITQPEVQGAPANGLEPSS